MSHLCLLVCEGEAACAAALAAGLGPAGFRVLAVASLEAAVPALRQWSYDAIVVVRDGAGSADRAVRRLRSASAAPVLVVAGPSDEAAQLRELDAGAAAVLAGAPSPRLVGAQLRQLLAAADLAPARERLRVGDLSLDPHRLAVSAGSHRLDLSESQFEVLFLLASRAGSIVARDALQQVLRASGSGERRVDTHVYWIRRRMAEAGARGISIETVHGRGYCLVPAPPARAAPRPETAPAAATPA